MRRGPKTHRRQFVPDGQTITWRIKDTTNGGDFVGQDWESVDASETVDCGCSGGVVDLTLGSCGNGAATPTVTLDVIPQYNIFQD